MNLQQVYDIVRPATTAFVGEEDLEELDYEPIPQEKRFMDHIGIQWYKCLCGGTDHRMYRSVSDRWRKADFVHCFITKQQWWVRPIDVAGVIKREEELALEHMKRAEKIVPKLFQSVRDVTGEKLAKAHHTHGVGPETVECFFGEVLGQEVMSEYMKHFKEHKKTGRK